MKYILVIYFFSIVFTSCFYGQRYRDSSLQKIETTLQAIENLYVDTINSHQLIEDAIIALLQKLDPHSDYMTLEEVNEMNEPLQGNFDGIGIQFNMLSDTLYVIQVISDGPSAKAGIVAGDRIVEVNDTVIAGKGMKNTDIVKRLRGQKGTIVNVKIVRDHLLYPMQFKIVRDKIPICSVDASYMLDKKTGYIKLNRFGATTYEGFKKTLQELQQKGLKNLILDLQDNGGGYLQTAIDITNEFLKRNALIVYTEGAHQMRERAYASTIGSFLRGKVVVLINESTASASEIVSGALQDWDRAVIVGRRSFGKGLVQLPIPLIDGSMIKLTTARYYTPTGRSIQKPYKKGHKEPYEKDLIDRYNRGEMIVADSIHFPDSLKYYTLMNKRIVYGGGGIMPDYFVPMDTIRYTDIHRLLIASGVINQFIINYMDKNRSSLSRKYQEIDTYKLEFDVSDDMLRELLDLFKKENIEMIDSKNAASLIEWYGGEENRVDKNQDKKRRTSASLSEEDMKQFEKSSSLIKLQIKALIAQSIWSTNEYYQIMNEESDVIKKAMEIIKNNNKYYKLLGK